MDSFMTRDEMTATLEPLAGAVHLVADALRSAGAELQTCAKREELGAVQDRLLAILNKQTLVMNGIIEIVQIQSETIAGLRDKLDAQSYALSGLGGAVLSQTGFSPQRIFNAIVNAPGYEPINDQVEPILRRIFDVRPALKVVSSAE